MYPQVRSNPKATVECPLSLQHAVGRGVAPQGAVSRALRASFLEVSPRSRGKDEPRQGQRPAKGARLRSNVPSRSVQVSRYWLAISERRGRKLTTAPVSAPPGKGCRWPAEWVTVRFVHASLIVKTDSRGVHRDAPSGELRQRRSELGGQSAPKGNDRSSAEGEERFGARWNGLANESLAAPPVRHHGPGAANADADLRSDAVRGCSQHPRFSRFTSPPRRSEGFDRGSPKRPRSPRFAYHCAARCFGRGPAQPSGDGRVGASRLARKHVSFRRLQKLDSGRHGAAAAGE